MDVQPGLCGTSSETLKDMFSHESCGSFGSVNCYVAVIQTLMSGYDKALLNTISSIENLPAGILKHMTMSCVMRKSACCICKKKAQINCAVTAQLISAFFLLHR